MSRKREGKWSENLAKGKAMMFGNEILRLVMASALF